VRSRFASVTGQIAFVFVFLFFVLLSLRQLTANVKWLLLILILMGTFSIIVVYNATGGSAQDALLEGAGKNSTLTGRTILWAISGEVASTSQIVGIGFEGFWFNPRFTTLISFIHANIDEDITGFHNAYVEAYVGLGIVGVSIFITTLAVTLVRLIRIYAHQPSITSAFWLSALLAVMSLGLLDDSFFKLHSLHYWIAVTAIVKAKEGIMSVQR